MKDKLLNVKVERSIPIEATSPDTYDSSLMRSCDVLFKECDAKLAEIRKLHDQVINQTNPELMKKNREDAETATRELKELINRAHSILKEMSSRSHSENDDSTTKRIVQTQLFSKREKLRKIVEEFQSAQEKYKGDFRSKVKRQYRIAKPGKEELSDEQLDEIIFKNQSGVAQALGQNSKLAQMQIEIQEEVQEIHAIEQHVVEVAALFQQLNTIILAQGEVIDSIEGNIAHALDHVERGADQLAVANQSQQSSRKMHCCLIIVVLIIAILLLGGLFW